MKQKSIDSILKRYVDNSEYAEKVNKYISERESKEPHTVDYVESILKSMSWKQLSFLNFDIMPKYEQLS